MGAARRGRRARARPALAAIGCAAALFTVPSRATATPSAKLTYLRGPGAERCPDEAELRKAVASRLGYDIFFPWAKTTVVAEIGRETKGYSGRVQVVDERANVRGQRAITSASDDCADVVRALALAISIAVDDFGLDDAPPPPSPSTPNEERPHDEPPPSVVRPSEAEPEKKTAVRVSPVATSPVVVALWVAPIVSFGVAPSVAAGAHLDLDVRYRFVSLGLEARGDLPASASAAPGGRVSTAVVVGSLVPCVRVPAPVFGCVVVSIGDFHESGSGLASPRSADAAFAAIGPRLGVELPLGKRLFFSSHADALITVTRHVVQVDRQNAFVIAPASGTLGIGAGVRF